MQSPTEALHNPTGGLQASTGRLQSPTGQWRGSPRGLRASTGRRQGPTGRSRRLTAPLPRPTGPGHEPTGSLRWPTAGLQEATEALPWSGVPKCRAKGRNLGLEAAAPLGQHLVAIVMNHPTPIRFTPESPRHRLLRVLQPDYLLALLRSRSRRVLVGMTLCVSLGICWALQSPTYQARVVMDVKGMCPHGFLINSFGTFDAADYQHCPHCKPRTAK